MNNIDWKSRRRKHVSSTWVVLQTLAIKNMQSDAGMDAYIVPTAA